MVSTPGPLNVIDEGVDHPDGVAIVLLHALGTDASLWRPQREAWRPHRRVVCIEAPGHGNSPVWDEVSLDTLARAVWAVADHLGLQRLTLAGTSMGAVIALQAAALQAERVHRLVLMGALLVRPPSEGDLGQRAAQAAAQDMRPLADQMIPRWFPDGIHASEAMRQQVREMVLRTAPEGYARCAQACTSYDLSSALALLQGRTCLVTGLQDGNVPAHFRALATAHPQLQLVELDAVGHFPGLEQPERVNPLLG